MKQKYFLNKIYFCLGLFIVETSFSADQKVATMIAMHDLYHLLLLNEEVGPLHARADIEVVVRIRQYNSEAGSRTNTHYLRLYDPTIFCDGSRIYDYSLGRPSSGRKTGEVKVISDSAAPRVLLQERGMAEILAGIYGPPLAPSIFSTNYLSPAKIKCRNVKISVVAEERVPFKELVEGQVSFRRLEQVLRVDPIEHLRRTTIRLGEQFNRDLVEYSYDHQQLCTQRYFASRPPSSFPSHTHVYKRNHTKTQTVIEEERERIHRVEFGASGLRCGGKRV